MQSWRGWYSSGPENRHPERVSGFDLRSAPVVAKQMSPGHLATLCVRYSRIAWEVEHPLHTRKVMGSLAELGVASVASPGCLRPHGEHLAVLAQLEEQRSFKP